MTLYRVLLHLYPRAFRREYGDDMAALLRHQLRDEHVVRVLARTVVDLLVTIPSIHLEAHMHRSAAAPVVVVLVALGAVLALVGGPVGLLAAAAAFAVAVVTWRRSQPIVAAVDARWWKLVLGGVALFGIDMLAANLVGELPDGWWYVAMVVGLTSLVLMATGVVLGIASRFARTART